MDLKDLFDTDTHIRIEHRFGDSERISVDYLYQAFKQRLCEDLRYEIPADCIFSHERRLIDTADTGARDG